MRLRVLLLPLVLVLSLQLTGWTAARPGWRVASLSGSTTTAGAAVECANTTHPVPSSLPSSVAPQTPTVLAVSLTSPAVTRSALLAGWLPSVSLSHTSQLLADIVPDAVLASSSPAAWSVSSSVSGSVSGCDPYLAVSLPPLPPGWATLTLTSSSALASLDTGLIVLPVSPFARADSPHLADLIRGPGPGGSSASQALARAMVGPILRSSPHGVWAWDTSAPVPTLVVAHPAALVSTGPRIGGIAGPVVDVPWASVLTGPWIPEPEPDSSHAVVNMAIPPVPTLDAVLLVSSLGVHGYTIADRSRWLARYPTEGAYATALSPANIAPQSPAYLGAVLLATMSALSGNATLYRVEPSTRSLAADYPGLAAAAGPSVSVASLTHTHSRPREILVVTSAGALLVWAPRAATWHAVVATGVAQVSASSFSSTNNVVYGPTIGVLRLLRTAGSPPMMAIPMLGANMSTADVGGARSLVVGLGSIAARSGWDPNHWVMLDTDVILESPILADLGGAITHLVALPHPLPLLGALSFTAAGPIARAVTALDTSSACPIMAWSTHMRAPDTALRAAGSLADAHAADTPAQAALPSPLNLNFGDSASVAMSVTFAPWYTDAVEGSVRAAVASPGLPAKPSLLTTKTETVTRAADGSTTVSVNVSVADPGLFVNDASHLAGQGNSGADLELSEILLEIGTGVTRWACPDVPTRIEVATLTGCPPGYSLELNMTATFERAEGCEPGDDVLCLYYESVFEPVLDVRDAYSGTADRYSGLIEFRIIGGGETRSELRRWSPDEIARYNLGSDTMWTFDSSGGGVDSSDPVLATSSPGVSFVCSGSSPCAGILPRFPRTPEYYVIVSISTRRVDRDSYCALTTEFILRVHGVPIGFTASISFVSATVVGLLIPIVIAFCCQQRAAAAAQGDDDNNRGHPMDSHIPSRRDLFG